MNDHIPPQDLDAEQAVLGCMLTEAPAIDTACDMLTASDFYRHAHAQIFLAMRDLRSQDKPADLLTVADWLGRDRLEECGGHPYLVVLLDKVPHAASVAAYASLVRDAAIRRAILAAAHDACRFAHDRDLSATQALARAQQEMINAAAGRLRRAVVPVGELVSAIWEEALDETKRPKGIATGIAPLDEIVTELRPGNLAIVAARPSVGKTSLCCQVAWHAATHGRPVLICTLEMTAAEITNRIVAQAAQIRLKAVQERAMNEGEWRAFGRVGEKARILPLHIEDGTARTPAQIASVARRCRTQHGLDLLVVDYLQMLSADTAGESRVQEVASAARALKALGRQLDCAILCVAALNKTNDIRECDGVSYEADLMIYLSRSDDGPPPPIETVTARVVKQRNGPTGGALLAFHREQTRFTALCEDRP